MARRTWIPLAVAAALMAAGLALRAPAGQAGAAPDLTGMWRLDPAASAAPRFDRFDRGGPRGERGARPEGGMRRDGMRRGPGGGASPDGMRRGRPGLPDLIHVTHTESLVSFEDSTGAVIQEITTLGNARDTLAHAPGARVLAGAWRDATLEVKSTGPPGGTMTQTITLEENGSALVIRTRTEFEGGAREFKRVYRRDES